MKNNEVAWCVGGGGRPMAHPSNLTAKCGYLVDSNEPIKEVIRIWSHNTIGTLSKKHVMIGPR